MSFVQKIYCIYNAEGSVKGELIYLYKKYFKDIKCSMCDITHSTFSQKKKWKNKCLTFPLEIKCLHLDELPSDIKILVDDKTPCVVAQINSTNKIIIKNEELVHINGDVDSFFSYLNKVIKIKNRTNTKDMNEEMSRFMDGNILRLEVSDSDGEYD